jgi:hypothetical protein
MLTSPDFKGPLKISEKHKIRYLVKGGLSHNDLTILSLTIL